MTDNTIIHGAITHAGENTREDHLFRVSLKAVIFNEDGHVLVVKETGRSWWDLPGGGINHGETIKQALARELYEEVSLKGDLEYVILLAEDPLYLDSLNLYQMRITFLVRPFSMEFKKGDTGEEVKFIDANLYENSDLWTERQIFKFSSLAKNK